ncbi:hypothetical protein [Aquamicrobium sp.]|uniref:hypothetical protein n=1 Tax=Aquamicrobium sp. TaxID=1872579 RepID=UPI0025896B7E|nr:hypothetical protein [Aquamicrobium sp.]MCK9553269.1 hypothetical protein [Aquamicrobium sp.]
MKQLPVLIDAKGYKKFIIRPTALLKIWLMGYRNFGIFQKVFQNTKDNTLKNIEQDIKIDEVTYQKTDIEGNMILKSLPDKHIEKKDVKMLVVMNTYMCTNTANTRNISSFNGGPERDSDEG